MLYFEKYNYTEHPNFCVSGTIENDSVCACNAGWENNRFFYLQSGCAAPRYLYEVLFAFNILFGIMASYMGVTRYLDRAKRSVSKRSFEKVIIVSLTLSAISSLCFGVSALVAGYFSHVAYVFLCYFYLTIQPIAYGAQLVFFHESHQVHLSAKFKLLFALNYFITAIPLGIVFPSMIISLGHPTNPDFDAKLYNQLLAYFIGTFACLFILATPLTYFGVTPIIRLLQEKKKQNPNEFRERGKEKALAELLEFRISYAYATPIAMIGLLTIMFMIGYFEHWRTDLAAGAAFVVLIPLAIMDHLRHFKIKQKTDEAQEARMMTMLGSQFNETLVFLNGTNEDGVQFRVEDAKAMFGEGFTLLTKSHLETVVLTKTTITMNDKNSAFEKWTGKPNVLKYLAGIRRGVPLLFGLCVVFVSSIVLVVLTLHGTLPSNASYVFLVHLLVVLVFYSTFFDFHVVVRLFKTFYWQLRIFSVLLSNALLVDSFHNERVIILALLAMVQVNFFSFDATLPFFRDQSFVRVIPVLSFALNVAVTVMLFFHLIPDCTNTIVRIGEAKFSIYQAGRDGYGITTVLMAWELRYLLRQKMKHRFNHLFGPLKKVVVDDLIDDNSVNAETNEIDPFAADDTPDDTPNGNGTNPNQQQPPPQQQVREKQSRFAQNKLKSGRFFLSIRDQSRTSNQEGGGRKKRYYYKNELVLYHSEALIFFISPFSSKNSERIFHAMIGTFGSCVSLVFVLDFFVLLGLLLLEEGAVQTGLLFFAFFVLLVCSCLLSLRKSYKHLFLLGNKLKYASLETVWLVCFCCYVGASVRLLVPLGIYLYVINTILLDAELKTKTPWKRSLPYLAMFAALVALVFFLLFNLIPNANDHLYFSLRPDLAETSADEYSSIDLSQYLLDFTIALAAEYFLMFYFGIAAGYTKSFDYFIMHKMPCVPEEVKQQQEETTTTKQQQVGIENKTTIETITAFSSNVPNTSKADKKQASVGLQEIKE